MKNATVSITEEGRSGSVYFAMDGHRITGWWEFGGGDAVAMVSMGSASEWQHGHPWAVARRAEILRFVGDEVVRQKASGCTPVIDEEGGWITIRH